MKQSKINKILSSLSLIIAAFALSACQSAASNAEGSHKLSLK